MEGSEGFFDRHFARRKEEDRAQGERAHLEKVMYMYVFPSHVSDGPIYSNGALRKTDPKPLQYHTLALYPVPTNLLPIFHLWNHFLPSSAQNTQLATAIKCTKSINPSASVWKMLCSGGK